MAALKGSDKTSLKKLGELGFTLEDNEAYLAGKHPLDNAFGLARDSNGDFRLTVGFHTTGQPLNTLRRVQAVAKALYGIELPIE